MNILPKEFTLPGRTICGRGTALQILCICAEFGKQGIIVHGRTLEKNGAIERIARNKPEGLSVSTWRHKGSEPTLSDVADLCREARKKHADWIAAVGGGSVIDLAKAAAGLLNGSHDIEAYHDGEPLEREGIPLVAAPTTAGTGSEATIVSVLINDKKGVKKSIRHPSFMPRAVVLDSKLLGSCPPEVIASSGMDAFTQAVESYVSSMATWLTDALALKGLELVGSNLEAVYKGSDGKAADELLIGSYITGVALSAARLGLVHGVAHPLGVRYHVTHGLTCAACLPHVIEFNRGAMGTKYRTMSNVIGKDLLETIRYFLRTFNIRSPFAGKTLKDEQRIVEETLESGSTAANPRPVTAADVKHLLKRLFKK